MSETAQSGLDLLLAWCERNGVASGELARRIQKRAKKSRKARKTRRPPYTNVRRWLSGEWTPQYVYRWLIEEVTANEVPADAWERGTC